MSTTDDDGAGRGTLPNGLDNPVILMSIPAAERDAFFPLQNWAALSELGSVRIVEPHDLQSLERFAEHAVDVNILITGWGFPALTTERLALLPKLELVMHSASSVRALVSPAFWESEVPISQAGAAMSPAVAELSLSFTLSLLRRTHRLDSALRGGATWNEARVIPRAREIGGARIGVIGASRTGRAYIAACRALGADIKIYDPYLNESDPLFSAAVTLDDLMAWSEVVAVHAPATPETEGLISRQHIDSMREGALFVNTARSEIVDMDALYEAASAGRIDIALDVFDLEPLPTDDRWRQLEGALLTPHLGGATVESRQRAGAIVVEEIRRHLTGVALEHLITRAAAERMA